MKKIYILLIASVLVTTSCNKFDDDINTDPNRPSTASGTQLIANAELSLGGLSEAPQGEFLAQYLAETQYPGQSLYPDGGTSFYGLYQGPLMNLETAINSKLTAVEGPVDNQIAVAKILKAYYIWHITDRWGDVPYSKALQGEKDFTPEYDTQQAIYNSLFELLTEASGSIVAGNISNDITSFKGDMTKWKKLANTIRLLMALRISNVDATKGKDEFEKALAAGIMTANTDNFVFNHLADANNQSYWYGQVVTQNREWWALTTRLVDELKPVNDPRLPVYGKPTRSDNDYVGLTFGTETGMNVTDFSLMGSNIYAQDAAIHLVTYAQALFAQAEAAKLGWITGGDATAATNYNAAIEASVLQWTGSTAGVADLITQPGIVYDPANAIKQIATQRWVHLFMHGYEAWAEWRRTGYPDNLIAPKGKAVPTRNAYPANENFNNAENYKAAVQRQFSGTDDLYGKVWWDKP